MSVALEAGIVGRDPEKLRAFYVDVMGFTLVEQFDAVVGRVRKFRRDDAWLKVFFSVDTVDPVQRVEPWFKPGGWRYAALYLDTFDEVDDLAAAVDAAGGRVLIPPANHREGRAWRWCATLKETPGSCSPNYECRTMNNRVYIHEFIDVIGHNRANYMQHMTANWSPIGQEERGQLCYGVWALIGSTGMWPKTVNMWEHDSWSGLAASFAVEATGRGAQDPALEKWWAKAAEFRSGGLDRIVVPAPWARGIEQLCADGVRGDVYAHELVTVEPGAAADVLERARDASELHARHGWELAGAFTTAMTNDHEALLLWAIPTWQQWADGEGDRDLAKWRRGFAPTTWQRILLVDAPLCPFRIGRQPARSDRVDWHD